ncbi:MAG: JAB domain-containing protein [Polyangiales bacterium]
MSTCIDLDLDPDELPLRRARRLGLDALSDAELLTLALGRGRGPAGADDLARRLLRDHGGLRGITRSGWGALAQDLGEGRAARLGATLEIARRARAQPLQRAPSFSSSRDVLRAFGPRLIDAAEEMVLAVILDARQRPLAERVLGRGSATACALGPRELFALAVREGGAAVVLVHNHPSGDPLPSEDDILLTRSLLQAGRLLDLPLIDHVIVGREGTFSFLDAGMLAGTSGDGP